MTQRSRGWCITINNWNEEDKSALKNLKYKYLIFGEEIAPTTGTPHLQGYVYYTNATNAKRLNAKLNNRAHLIAANGTGEENKKYCSKGANIFEDGIMPRAGNRSDIQLAKDMVKDGCTMKEIYDSVDSYQAVKFAEGMKKLCDPVRTWKPNVYWFYGESGSGKTKMAYEKLPNAWWSGENLKWWDGYDGHKDVIIDDFRGSHCKFSTLLRILDRYPYTVETKGGTRQLVARNIIITCNKHPKDVYQDKGENLVQLLRRIDGIVPFGKTDTDTEVGR